MDDIYPALNELAKKYENIAVCLKGVNETLKINVDNIKSIVSCNHYIVLNETDGSKKQIRCKISDAEEQLRKYGFVRVQNGMIINLKFVRRIDSRKVILTDGERFNIGRNCLDNLRHDFQKFRRSI